MYSLALRMGRTVAELLDTIDAGELVHWFAYYDIDPWTDDRADWRMGMICAVTKNSLVGSDHQPDDFVPKFKAAELTTEVDDDLLLLQGMKWAAMYGGTIKA